MIPTDTFELILKRTEDALTQQVDVPLSPGQVCESGHVLCAGAMLVHEALAVLRSPADAAEFVRRVTNEDCSYIENTGEAIGLDREMVIQTKHLNDTLDDEDRLAGTVRALRELRAPV